MFRNRYYRKKKQMDRYGEIPGPGRPAVMTDFTEFCSSIGKAPTPEMQDAAWESVKGLSAMGYALFGRDKWAAVVSKRPAPEPDTPAGP